MILLPPMGLAIVAWLVNTFAKEAKGHGVPEVIQAVLSQGGKIRARVVAIKAVASAITLASGGSLGREGPIVQIGSAAGSTLGQFFKLNPKHMKILVGCGAAAAIGATFNTPIAGVIFAVELIVLELRAKSFVPLVIASVFATMISRYHLGNEPAFNVPSYTLTQPSELIFYLGLAVLAGLVGAFVIHALYWIEDLFDGIDVHYLLKAVFGGLLIGLVGYRYPQIFGVGYETISDVLNETLTIQLMASLVALKILMMSITIAAGGSGGIFAPSLFIGAMLGGSYGWILNQFFPYTTAGYGAYALVGMAALYAATTRATFTAIVILFEMTLDYEIILPLMFVCVIADQISIKLSKSGTIYSIKLKRKGLNFLNEFGVNIFAITPISEIMTKELVVVKDHMKLKEAHEILVDHPHVVYPVVNEGGILLGQVKLLDLEEGLQERGEDAEVNDFMRGTPAVVYPNESALNSLKKLEKSRDPRIVVVDRNTKKLLGIVSPTDFVRLSTKELESS